jgi:predicted phage terminase large subunit-like protein
MLNISEAVVFSSILSLKEEVIHALHHKKDAANRSERLKTAKTDFAYFCETYMPQAFPIPFADYQLALTRLVSTRQLNFADELLFKSVTSKEDHCFIKMPDGPLEGILDIEPRDHGKTTRNTQALPLWLALNYPGSFIVICAASSDSAQDMIDGIKTMLEEDDVIIADYGIQKVKGNMWAKRKIQLANGSAIQAVGAGQSLRGVKNEFQRPTHVICDDLLKDDEVESVKRRRALHRWFKRVILNLGKGALTIIANTIMHPDDLPSRLLKEIADGTMEDWIGLRFGAITPKGESLWPHRWPLPELMKKKKKLGSHIWATEYENKPMSDDEKVFNMETIKTYHPSDVDLRDCDIGMAVDPATGSVGGDDSAIAVVAKHRATGMLYALLADGWLESDLKFARRIVSIYLEFRPSFVIIEDVAFQKIYRREIQREALRLGVILPSEGFRGGNKFVRIKSLQALFETETLLILESMKNLKDQLDMYPRGKDDIPDALEMCISRLITVFVGGAAAPRRKPKPNNAMADLVSRFGSKMRRLGR